MAKKESSKPFDLYQRDGRKKLFLVIDTETAGDITRGTNSVYDLGFSICDKKGNVYYKRNFLIQEVWDDIDLMNTAYYACKIPLYIEMLRNKQIEKVTLKQAIKFLIKIANEYNVSNLAAYNLLFDTKALRYTMKKYLPEYRNFRYDCPFQFMEVCVFRRPMTFTCIYCLSCQLIATKRGYVEMALANNGIIEPHDWITKADHIRTNAQCVFRYISNNPQFIEAHTAQADVDIEVKILAYCLRQTKKHNKEIFYFPWREAQPNFYQFRGDITGDYKEFKNFQNAIDNEQDLWYN